LIFIIFLLLIIKFNTNSFLNILLDYSNRYKGRSLTVLRYPSA